MNRYRLLWQPSFHNDWVISIELRPGSGLLTATELERQDKQLGRRRWTFGVPARVHSVTRELSIHEQARIVVAVENTAFWSHPPTDGRLGYDGASFLIEVNENRRYHAVDRWSPRDGGFRDLAAVFLELAQIDISDAYPRY